MQAQKYAIKWIVTAEATQNEVSEEDDLQQNAFVQEILLQLDFSTTELSPVLEQQVRETVELVHDNVRCGLQIRVYVLFLKRYAYIYFFNQESILAGSDDPQDRSFASLFIIVFKVLCQICSLERIDLTQDDNLTKRSQCQKENQQRLVLKNKAELFTSNFHAVFQIK